MRRFVIVVLNALSALAVLCGCDPGARNAAGDRRGTTAQRDTAILNTAASGTVNVARDLAKPFRRAWGAFNIPLKEVGPTHHWNCDSPDGASFGPDNLIFFPIGTDHLIMNWYDHNLPLLRRSQSDLTADPGGGVRVPYHQEDMIN